MGSNHISPSHLQRFYQIVYIDDSGKKESCCIVRNGVALSASYDRIKPRCAVAYHGMTREPVTYVWPGTTISGISRLDREPVMYVWPIDELRLLHQNDLNEYNGENISSLKVNNL